MKFVAVEGIDFQIVRSLRAYGHDVLYIAESATGSLGELVFRDRMFHSGII